VIALNPVTLEGHGVRLEPLTPAHHEGLAAAAADGRLWELWFTSVPEPERTGAYIAGSTRYHDIAPAIDRVEIGYTWYAARWQRSHVNTACKLLLLAHVFETLGCRVVGFRTDNINVASQRAIAALGALKDGILRHHQARRDGTVRDSVRYSILAAEWPAVKQRLTARLARHGTARSGTP